MNNIDKIKEVFRINRVIAAQLGDQNIMSIIDGIEKEVLDVISEESE